jgi:hypothetical protein
MGWARRALAAAPPASRPAPGTDRRGLVAHCRQPASQRLAARGCRPRPSISAVAASTGVTRTVTWLCSSSGCRALPRHPAGSCHASTSSRSVPSWALGGGSSAGTPARARHVLDGAGDARRVDGHLHRHGRQLVRADSSRPPCGFLPARARRAPALVQQPTSTPPAAPPPRPSGRAVTPPGLIVRAMQRRPAGPETRVSLLRDFHAQQPTRTPADHPASRRRIVRRFGRRPWNRRPTTHRLAGHPARPELVHRRRLLMEVLRGPLDGDNQAGW